MIIVAFFITVSLLFITLYWYRKRNLPPGPCGVPILGFVPFIGSNPCITIENLAAKYGSVMRINFMGNDVYFLNNLEVVKEAFVTQGDNFAGRPIGEFNTLSFLLSDRSVTTSEGDFWKVHQKFIISKLSKLGVGKSELELKIHEICESVVKYVENNCNKEVDYGDILMNFSSNVISALIYSKHYDLNDPDYVPLRDMMKSLFVSDKIIATFFVGKIFKTMLMVNRKLFNLLKEFKAKFYSYLKDVLQDRMNDSDSDNYDDLLSGYLKETKGINSKYFDEQTIMNNFVTMFTAGTVTTAKTLYHGLYLMAVNEEIQLKLQKEIDETIGKNQVSIHDSSRLNYTHAVIAEIHRFASISPFTLLHTNKIEAVIDGYRIPKRSKVVANIRSLSRDKRRFKNTNSFDPNNFLNENGEYVANEANIPFSIGKRRCTGAKLAEMEILLCFVTLMQKFNWSVSESEILSDDAWALNSTYKLIATKR